MIPYVEIIRETADGCLKVFSFIEPSECWFELKYHGFGEFELYCPATKKNLNALKKGYFVKIPNKRFGWVITSIQYDSNEESGVRMISAKGYEMKWLLKKRIIQKPIQLSKDLFLAVHGLVNANIGERASEARKIPFFNSVLNSEAIAIPDTQATRGNLGEYVDTLLTAHSCGSTAIFVGEGSNTLGIAFEAYKGRNRANSVRFSQSFDNLLSSTYYSSDENVGSFALVVSTVDDVDYTKEVDKGAVGSKRSEILVESNISTKYEDASGAEKETTPDSTLYQGWQEEEGKNKLAEHITIEEVSGEIDLQNSLYQFDEDFFLGDVVRVQDEYFNFFLDTRIAKITIKQDSSGYGEEIEYNE